MTIDNSWYASATLDELYAHLGAHLLGTGLGSEPGDQDEPRRFGQSWFEDRKAALQKAVCGNDLVRALGEDLTGDVVDIAALVLPLLGHDPILALTAAGIILRRGIASFCANYQNAQ